jgi:hypothetical protein
MLPRIRQAVLVTTSLEPVVDRLRSELGRFVTVPEPYRDPGVDRFGLENAVLSIGDSFLEVLAPVRPDTAAGRHLQRRGGDAGYMVMLQVADMADTRERLDELAVRVVWQAELPDAVDLHLHPHDVPGALVAVDTMDPPASWRWGGPGWTGTAPRHETAGIAGLTVAVPDPDAAARRWAAVAGLAEPDGAALSLAGVAALSLAGGAQRIDFVPATDERAGLIAIAFALPGARRRQDDIHIGSATIEIHPGREADHG